MARRWAILALGALAQLATSVVVAGAAFLIPALHADHGLTLSGAATLTVLPTEIGRAHV